MFIKIYLIKFLVFINLLKLYHSTIIKNEKIIYKHPASLVEELCQTAGIQVNWLKKNSKY